MLRLKELLFPSIADVAVLSVDVNIEMVRVDAHCTTAGAVCPGCGAWSTRVHSSYLRFPADVPSAGRTVVLQLRVRRFRCRNTLCSRRTFAEQIPGLTRRHGQRTERLRSTLASVGLALAGRAGARLTAILGVSVSRSTVLRLIDALPRRTRRDQGTPRPRPHRRHRHRIRPRQTPSPTRRHRRPRHRARRPGDHRDGTLRRRRTATLRLTRPLTLPSTTAVTPRRSPARMNLTGLQFCWRYQLTLLEMSHVSVSPDLTVTHAAGNSKWTPQTSPTEL